MKLLQKPDLPPVRWDSMENLALGTVDAARWCAGFWNRSITRISASVGILSIRGTADSAPASPQL